MDGWRNLANAIIETAAHDYRKALTTLRRYPGSYTAMRQKQKLEKFFRSDLYAALTDVDGEYMIEKLRKDVDYLQHRLRIKR